MQTLKFGVEKFDGKMNFGLWQIQVKDILIQSGLHKVLKGKPTSVSDKDPEKVSSKDSDKGTSTSSMSDDDWEEMDLKAASTIRLCLAKNVLANVQGNLTTKELWEKLEEMYQAKGVSNRVYLKEQFHTLRMSEGTTISDHLSVLNGIVSELETLGVQIDDEDKALRLIWSLPSSYEHMKPILIHGKEKIFFSEVTGKLLSEEKRLSERNNFTHENSALVAGSWRKKKKSTKENLVCWGCGQPGHVKRNCPKGGAGSANSSKDDANSVSLAIAGDGYDESCMMPVRGMDILWYDADTRINDVFYLRVHNCAQGTGFTVVQGAWWKSMSMADDTSEKVKHGSGTINFLQVFRHVPKGENLEMC